MVRAPRGTLLTRDFFYIAGTQREREDVGHDGAKRGGLHGEESVTLSAL